MSAGIGGNDRLEDVEAGLGVLAHLLPLGGVERPGLEQDGVGHADLADVVQERPAEDVVPLTTMGTPRRSASASV